MTDAQTLAWIGLESGDSVVVRRATRKPASAAGPSLHSQRSLLPPAESFESAGGITIETEHDMPALEALLEAYDVKSAILFYDANAEQTATAPSAPPSTWQERARQEMREAVVTASTERPLEEEFAFLATLTEEELDTFLARAEGVLTRPGSVLNTWSRFLQREARAAYATFAYSPLTDVLQMPEVDPERPPRLTLADLSVSFEKGAIGTAAPLASRSA